MTKQKLMIAVGVFFLLAIALTGCGGGGADSSSAAPPGGMAQPGPVGAPPSAAMTSPSGAPVASPNMTAGASAGATSATSAPAPSAADQAKAGTSEEPVALDVVIPASRRKPITQKQWDGSVVKLEAFRYKGKQGRSIAVELPADVSKGKMSRADWADTFMSWSVPTEELSDAQQFEKIRPTMDSVSALPVLGN